MKSTAKPKRKAEDQPQLVPDAKRRAPADPPQALAMLTRAIGSEPPSAPPDTPPMEMSSLSPTMVNTQANPSIQDCSDGLGTAAYDVITAGITPGSRNILNCNPTDLTMDQILSLFQHAGPKAWVGFDKDRSFVVDCRPGLTYEGGWGQYFRYATILPSRLPSPYVIICDEEGAMPKYTTHVTGSGVIKMYGPAFVNTLAHEVLEMVLHKGTVLHGPIFIMIEQTESDPEEQDDPFFY